MIIDKNILSVPVSRKTSLSREKLEESSVLKGTISNGCTRVYATISSSRDARVEVNFKVDVNSVDVEDFNFWRLKITRILGRQSIEEIEVKLKSIFPYKAKINFEHCMSLYVLYVFEYIYGSGQITRHYINSTNVLFDSDQCSKTNCQDIISSIYELKSTVRCFVGQLVATDNDPVKEAYIPVTFFHFTDGKVVSFADYLGPVNIVTGQREMDSQPGLLTFQ
ncbi:MAG: hypothetical protein ACEPOZ_00335 [Marinifilaceae bacterium]